MHFQRSKSFLESPKSVFNAFVQVIAWFVVIFRNCFTQFPEPLGEWNLRQFWNITSGIYAKYHVQIMLLFVYTTTHKRFVIFTCRYFKLSGNTTALSQANCRIFSCSSMNEEAVVRYSWEFSAHAPVHIWRQPVFGTSFFSPSPFFCFQDFACKTVAVAWASFVVLYFCCAFVLIFCLKSWLRSRNIPILLWLFYCRLVVGEA